MGAWGDIGTVAMGALTVLGGVFALARYLYNRGGDERQWTTALDDNTAVTKELVSELRDFKTATVESLHRQEINHERLVARVGVLEEKLKG